MKPLIIPLSGVNIFRVQADFSILLLRLTLESNPHAITYHIASEIVFERIKILILVEQLTEPFLGVSLQGCTLYGTINHTPFDVFESNLLPPWNT